MVYDLIDWRLEYYAGTIAARPTWVNFLKRLVLTSLAGLLIYPLWSVSETPNWDSGSVYHWILVGMCGVLGAIGVLAPLCVLWQRARVERDVCGDLVISTFLFRRRNTRVPPGTIVSMPVVVTEERVHTRHVRRTVGWRWRVMLVSPGGKLEFWVDQSRSKPASISPPRRVKDFVAALEAMTGIPSMEPQLSAWMGRRRGFSLGLQRRITCEPSMTRHAFQSLDEVPPELRPEVEGLVQQAVRENVSTVKSQCFTIRDSDGHEETYHSVDEMPPDVRARFEGLVRRKPGP